LLFGMSFSCSSVGPVPTDEETLSERHTRNVLWARFLLSLKRNSGNVRTFVRAA
jgi:hypothetical protein